MKNQQNYDGYPHIRLRWKTLYTNWYHKCPVNLITVHTDKTFRRKLVKKEKVILGLCTSYILSSLILSTCWEVGVDTINKQ